MKTGLIRRIDDLGRLVVPKEVRQTLQIREGDPFEIWTQGDKTICFSKFNLLFDEDSKLITYIRSALYDRKYKFVIYDTSKVIKTSGHYGLEYPKSVSEDWLNYKSHSQLKRGNKIWDIFPIRSDGDLFGFILIIEAKSENFDYVEGVINIVQQYLQKG